MIKQSFDNFQYSKTMSTIFQRKKLVNCLIQAPNLGKLLCRCESESQHKHQEVRNCRKNCVSMLYLIKASLYQFKGLINTFFDEKHF